MKRVLSSLIVYVVVIAVSGQHGDQAYEAYDPLEDDLSIDDSSVDYMPCDEEGTCFPVHRSEDGAASYLDSEHQYDQLQYLQDAPSRGHKVSKSPYSKLCKKLDRKMQELESLHPELKSLKYQLLSMLDASISHFDSECKEGESIIVKLLDFVVHVAHKLKADFTNMKIKEIPVKIVSTATPIEEIIAEENPGFVGSVRGIPGKHYPDYSEVPITSFSCSDKKYIPGFYADLETGCQVFHVCYEHRRESFLCPPGTIFNQPILACDYWYSSNCSQAPLYYDVNAKKGKDIKVSKEETNIGDLITTIIEGDKPKTHKKPDFFIPKGDLNDLLKFLPIKAKVLEFQQPIKPKVVPSKPVVMLPKIKPLPLVKPMIKPLPLVKPKLAAKAIAAIPVAKAKFVAAAAVPVKAKIVSAAATPVIKAKVVAPVIKSKFVKLPIIKTKYAAASVPVFKAKTAAKVIPYVKLTAKKPKIVASVPIAKAKLAKAAMISPLTKKTLAIGYMKLLKAKKLGLMG